MMLSDVCLSRTPIGPKSRTERPRKTKIGTEVAHVTSDSDTTFKVKRSKGQGHRGGGILWRTPAHSLFYVLPLLCPLPGGIKRRCCPTSVSYIRSAGGVYGRPAGWRVLADRAWLGRPVSAGLAQGCRCALPLQAWARAYRGGRPPAYSLFCLLLFSSDCQ